MSFFKEKIAPAELGVCDFLSFDKANFTACPEKTIDEKSIDAISETLNKEVRANKITNFFDTLYLPQKDPIKILILNLE